MTAAPINAVADAGFAIGNRTFLNAIFTDLEPEEYMWTAQFPTAPKAAKAEQWGGMEVSERYQDRNPLHDGWNQYFCVAALRPHDGKRLRRKANFSRLYCLVIDDARAIATIPPTWILETSHATGSNRQIGYRLTEPLADLDRAIAIHQALADSGQLGDRNGNNPVRYVRLPWGANTKYAPPHRHRLLHWDPQQTADLDDLIQGLGLVLPTVLPSQTVAPVPMPSVGDPDGWMPRARKLAWDAARRTHDDPTLGRHAEIYRIGTYAARDGLPETALEYLLNEFARCMRPTDSAGNVSGINWDNERKTIRDGYRQSLSDGVPIAVDVSRLIETARIASAHETAAPAAPQPQPLAEYRFPRHLLAVPGLVGDTAEYILATSLFKQPVLALAASLAWCGAIMGRKVRTATDLRTNIYVIGVGDSGSGKEHARKAIKKLAVLSAMASYIGAEKLASDQGLFALLDAQPSCLALLDEFGRTLRVVNNDRAPAHLQQLMTTLMELSGSADSYIIEKRRAEHTGGTEPRIILNPNLCIYATTVPGRLYQGLTPDEVTDGFLPRYLVFESDCADPELSAPISAAPGEALIAAIAAWKDVSTNPDSTGNLKDLWHHAPTAPRVIPMTAEAETLFAHSGAHWRARKQQLRGTGLDALWARAYEHSARMALIVAAGHRMTIDRDIAAWACELTEFLLERASAQAKDCLASNEYEGDVQRVESFIRQQGSTTLAGLTRKFRKLKQKERDGILGSLIDARLIELVTTKTDGRSVTRITWIQDGASD